MVGGEFEAARGRPTLPDRVRDACAEVATRARLVRIAEDGVDAYAAELLEPGREEPVAPAPDTLGADRELRTAFVVCLDAINFGSGWWPTIDKRPGLSGYWTISAGLTERFLSAGAWPAEELAAISGDELGTVLGQDPAHPLMAQFAAALRDVGRRVGEDHGGSFAATVDAAAGSAAALAGLLGDWESFADVSLYEGREVPFFKRAQIVPADLARAGLSRFDDERRLTAFADNLVPHVLHLDGILSLDPSLSEAIDSGRLLVHESAGEVELRACAIHAVELISARSGLAPKDVDELLWTRGAGRRYKSRPRPRCRTTAY